MTVHTIPRSVIKATHSGQQQLYDCEETVPQFDPEINPILDDANCRR
jgi:hypothetical protein